MRAMAGAAVARERVYEKLADVQVPPGTAAGSKFIVLLRSLRRGKVVVVEKELWAGAVSSPAMQPRQVAECTGSQRHELRPSAAARAAAGSGSRRPIDSELSRAAQAESWSAAKPMPFEVLSLKEGTEHTSQWAPSCGRNPLESENSVKTGLAKPSEISSTKPTQQGRYRIYPVAGEPPEPFADRRPPQGCTIHPAPSCIVY